MLIKNANLSNMWKICLAICFIREVHFLFIENTFAFSFWYKCEIRNLQIHIYFDKFDQNWYFNHYRLGLNWKKQKRLKNYLERFHLFIQTNVKFLSNFDQRKYKFKNTLQYLYNFPFRHLADRFSSRNLQFPDQEFKKMKRKKRKKVKVSYIRCSSSD